jgi:hypothetical protein
MKNYLKTALAILFMVAFTEMNAQLRVGYVFGMNLSTMTLKSNGINYDMETPAGFHFGGFVEFPLTDNFALRPALLFTAKGSNYEIDSLEVTLSPIYIEVPVNALCSFGPDEAKVSLFAGPYFACGIGGYKIVSGGSLKDINYGSGGNDDLKQFDVGFNFGAGVNIRGFLISVQYGIGLANISPVTTFDTEMKNKVIGFSISAGSPGLSTTFGR